MKKNSCLVYISLLGDPDVEFGNPGTGGYNKTVRELLDYFSAVPVKIFVITNKNIYNSCSVTKIYDNIIIYRVDFGANWETNQDLIVENIDRILNNVLKIIESIKMNFEIKLIHSFYWLSGFISLQLKEKYSLPFVHTVVSLSEDKLRVGISPHTDKQRQIEDMFLSEASWIFAITHQEMHTLIQQYGISDNKIIVVGRSINKSFSEVFDKKTKYKNTIGGTKHFDVIKNDSWWVNGAFLYVGRIVKIKGVKQIISAWIYSKSRFNLNIPLWIVGGTPDQIEEIRKTILSEYPDLSKYEKDNRIIWWGVLDSAGISTLMRKSQALIMHSMFEAGGRVIIEALSAGIPVIATPFGYGKDYIFDGFNGYIVDFGDIKNLSKAMMRFADQPFLSSVMGKAAFAYMKIIHKSWNYFEAHCKVYKSFYTGHELLSIEQKKDLPFAIDSYKMRHCVDSFPFFNTDREIPELKEIVSKKIECQDIIPINNNDSHSDFYIIESDGNKYYLRCFYHILSDRLSRFQYKNVSVFSAYSQIKRILLSTQYKNISHILYCDIANLLCVMPYFNLIENGTLNCLTDLWLEQQPNNTLLDLYYKGDFCKLHEQVIESTDPLINNLFCAEIAYNDLFSKYTLPPEINKKVMQLAKTVSAVFGLNYGKGISGHVIEENGHFFLLPSSSIFLGELGFDLVFTFLQMTNDDPALWEEIKSKQNIVSDNRLDLQLLIIVFAREESSCYRNVIEYILSD